MATWVSRPVDRLKGEVRVPGDKSVSHRALLLGALAVGESRIHGLLEAEDVLNTARAVAALGAGVRHGDDGAWIVAGRGVGGLAEPATALDMGNSGTGARLLMGVLAAHPFTAFLHGDASLSARPMERVMTPLRRMGARFAARSGGRLPLAVTGSDALLPVEYEMPVASAQVKSAVLLAGLGAPGRTTVIEPAPTRDHTERLLRHFGAHVETAPRAEGGRSVTVAGQPELEATDVRVPADPSSAAFPLVAALITGAGRVRLPGVGTNPLRTGLFATLREMGAEIAETEAGEEAGEPVATLDAGATTLRGVEVPAERAPSMIDEYPVLAVAAACAEGVTRMHGLGELRIKESDRLAAIAEGLDACGVQAGIDGDTLTIHGCGGPPPGGGRVSARLDHRIAMSFLVLGTAARAPVTVDGAEAVDTSFPGFAALMNGLGARIEDTDAREPSP